MRRSVLVLMLFGMVSLTSFIFWAIPASAQESQIGSTAPAQNELSVPVSTDISVTFDVDMDETTINDFVFMVNLGSTGLHLGSITCDGPTRTATLDPVDDFLKGEVSTVLLTTGIRSSQAFSLDSPYVWCFTSLVYDGSGTPGPHSVYPAGGGTYSMSSADLDDDWHLNLASANRRSDNVSVLLYQPAFIRGNAGGERIIDVGDLVYLVTYLYRSGPPPGCP